MEHSVRLRRLDRSTLKIMALVTMTVGHFFLYTLKEIRCFGLGRPWSRLLCYVAFLAPPVFFFFIAEGFRYTHSRRAYAGRLLVFAVITQAAANLTFHRGMCIDEFFCDGNVFFTLLFGFLDLCILHSDLKLPLKFAGVASLLALSLLMDCEWRITGQLMILAFYCLGKKPWLNLAVFALLIVLDFGTGNLTMLFFLMLAAVLVLFCYNGEKGKGSRFLKYFFYVFYPLHLLAIGLFKSLMQG